MRTVNIRFTLSEDAYKAIGAVCLEGNDTRETIRITAITAIDELARAGARALEARQLQADGHIEIGGPSQ